MTCTKEWPFNKARTWGLQKSGVGFGQVWGTGLQAMARDEIGSWVKM